MGKESRKHAHIHTVLFAITNRGDYCIILYPNVQCTSVSVWYIS